LFDASTLMPTSLSGSPVLVSVLGGWPWNAHSILDELLLRELLSSQHARLRSLEVLVHVLTVC
jgi:hypothetical protein